jgi:hypothetical protein
VLSLHVLTSSMEANRGCERGLKDSNPWLPSSSLGWCRRGSGAGLDAWYPYMCWHPSMRAVWRIFAGAAWGGTHSPADAREVM